MKLHFTKTLLSGLMFTALNVHAAETEASHSMTQTPQPDSEFSLDFYGELGRVALEGNNKGRYSDGTYIEAGDAQVFAMQYYYW